LQSVHKPNKNAMVFTPLQLVLRHEKRRKRCSKKNTKTIPQFECSFAK